jgi:hypothetical protein
VKHQLLKLLAGVLHGDWSRTQEVQVSTLSRPYRTIDDAALGGFKKILLNDREWKSYEYGFLVIGLMHQIVRQLGHEGFMDTDELHHYTEPHTDRSKSSIDQTIPPQYAMLVRAFCHTHPTPGSFSSQDFRNFKKLRELTARHKLGHDVIYYLMESDLQVRRSSREENFREGDIIPGLDKATS